jgi:hypothetical protein
MNYAIAVFGFIGTSFLLASNHDESTKLTDSGHFGNHMDR